MEQKNNDQNRPGGDGKRPKLNIWVTILITVAIVILISTIFNAVSNSQYTETTYSDFLAAKAAGNLEEVEIRYDRIVYLTRTEAAKPASEQKA